MKNFMFFVLKVAVFFSALYLFYYFVSPYQICMRESAFSDLTLTDYISKTHYCQSRVAW